MREHLQLTFRHRAGVTPYTSTFVLAQCCVFIKQSQPPILCGLSKLSVFLLHSKRHTFSRSYGINLPSSFSRVLSSALEFSSYPPVSVCGTVQFKLKLSGFSWKRGISHFVSLDTRHHVSALNNRICLVILPTGLNDLFQQVDDLTFSVPTSHLN